MTELYKKIIKCYIRGMHKKPFNGMGDYCLRCGKKIRNYK